MPETQLKGLIQFLETIVNPAAVALCHAPLDDEPETAVEAAEVAKANTWLKNNSGKGIPHVEAIRRLGLE